MGRKIKAAAAAAVMTGALMLAPVVAADAAPVHDVKIASVQVAQRPLCKFSLSNFAAYWGWFLSGNPGTVCFT